MVELTVALKTVIMDKTLSNAQIAASITAATGCEPKARDIYNLRTKIDRNNISRNRYYSDSDCFVDDDGDDVDF